MTIHATLADLAPAYALALTGAGCPMVGRVEGLDDRGEPVDLGFVVYELGDLDSDHYQDGVAQGLGRMVQVIEASRADANEALGLARKVKLPRRFTRPVR